VGAEREGGHASQAAVGGGARVSYVMLVAGNCKHQTFKPAKDDSQWWGRRDALVRSVAAALWRTQGAAW